MDNKDYNDRLIDNIFTSELGNLEVTPPESVWKGIESKLDKKRRVGIIYIRIGLAAGIAFLITLSGIVFYKSSNNKVQDTDIIATTSVSKSNTISQQNSISARSGEKTSIGKSLPEKLTDITSKSSSTIKIRDRFIQNNRKQVTRSTNFKESQSSYSNSQDTLINNIAYLTPKESYIKAETKLTISLPEKLTNTEINPLTPVFGPEREIALEEISRKTGKWSIETAFAPSYSYRNITGLSKKDQVETRSDFNNNETGLLAYSANIKLAYKANNKLTVKSGIFYSIMGQTLNRINVFSKNSNFNQVYLTYQTSEYISCSFGPIPVNNINDPVSNSINRNEFNDYLSYPENDNVVLISNKTGANNNNASAGKMICQLQFIEIPVIAYYTLYSKKLQFYITGGVSTGFLINNSTYIKNGSDKEYLKKTEGLNTINFNSIAGIGFSYPIRKNIRFIAEPTFQYQINSITNKDVSNIHLYSYSFYTGLSFNL